jgi:REP element-mobilizing transposase RayT
MTNQCMLTEFNGEPDHIRLLIDVHPDNNISDLVASLKSASSRVCAKNSRLKSTKHIGVKLNFGMIPSASFPVEAHRLRWSNSILRVNRMAEPERLGLPPRRYPSPPLGRMGNSAKHG